MENPLAVTAVAAAATGLAAGLAAGPLAGLVSAVATGVIATPIYLWLFLTSFVTGLSIGDAEPGSWEADLRREGRHGLAFALAAFLTFGAIPGVATGIYAGPLFGLILGCCLGLWFGFFLGLFSGALYLEHYALRVLLVSADAGPWRYRAFLDAMTTALLLRRSGRTYHFAHRMLRDYLADLPPRPAINRDVTRKRLTWCRYNSRPGH